MSHIRAIARQTAVLTASQTIGLIVSLVGTVLVTRALGPDGRAVYAWLLTLAGIATQLALVAPPAAVRAIAVDEPENLPATLVVLCLAGALATVPLAVYAMEDPTIGREARPYLGLAWLTVPVASATACLFTLVQIEGRIGSVLLVQVGPRVMQALLAAALFFAGALTIRTALGMFLLTLTTELAATLFLLRARLGRPRPSLPLVRAVLRLLEAGWLSSVAIYAVPRIGLLVLGTQAPFEITGRYSVALTLQEASMVAPVALGGVLITFVGRHGGPTRLTRRRAALGVIGVTLATCAGAALLAPLFVETMFGAPFAPAAASYRLLLISVALATAYQLCQPLLFQTRSALAIATPALAAFAVASGTAFAAVPRLGLDGAILSNVLGFGTLAGIAVLFAVRQRRASPT